MNAHTQSPTLEPSVPAAAADTLWIVGGEQRGVPHWTKEWKLYKQALVVACEAGRLQRVLAYQSPPEHCADDQPSIVFKASSIAGDRAYLCTQTEVLVCDFPSFTIKQVISLPCFNDVHHVAVAPDGRLFTIAVTGLDAEAELTPDGTLLRLVSSRRRLGLGPVFAKHGLPQSRDDKAPSSASEFRVFSRQRTLGDTLRAA